MIILFLLKKFQSFFPSNIYLLHFFRRSTRFFYLKSVYITKCELESKHEKDTKKCVSAGTYIGANYTLINRLTARVVVEKDLTILQNAQINKKIGVSWMW